MSAKTPERSNGSQPNPAVMELQGVRSELEGVRDELIGLRADLKKRETFRITDQVAQGVLLAGIVGWFGVAVLTFLLQMLVGR
jgi:hypothetical protein